MATMELRRLAGFPSRCAVSGPGNTKPWLTTRPAVCRYSCRLAGVFVSSLKDKLLYRWSRLHPSDIVSIATTSVHAESVACPRIEKLKGVFTASLSKVWLERAPNNSTFRRSEAKTKIKTPRHKAGGLNLLVVEDHVFATAGRGELEQN